MRDYVGDCDWDHILPPTAIEISVDANKDGKLASVVHELLHVALFGMTMGWLDDQLEEAVIIGVERLMVEYITKSHTRTAQWKRLIAKKIKEQQDKAPIPTVEQMTSRPPSLNR